MARVFLHVGAHKTATSYLQAIFHRNHRLLAAHGVDYPHIGPNLAHHALAGLWQDVPGIPDGFYGPGGPAALWDRLIADHARRDGILFLSAENFTRARPQQVDMAELARRLQPFDAVRIIYTVRQQVDLVPSLWSQVAKSHHQPPDLGRYLRRVTDEGQAGGIPLDHGAVYRRLRSGFAADQIHLLDYETISAGPGGVLGAFLDLLGLDIPPDRFRPIHPDEANPTPDPLALYLATRIWPGEVPAPPRIAAIRAALQAAGAGAPTSLLTLAERQQIAAQFQPANLALAQTVASHQPGFAVTETPPPAKVLSRKMIDERVWAMVAAALHQARPGAISRPLSGRLGRAIQRLRHALRWRSGRY